jgi:hypothetical protein
MIGENIVHIGPNNTIMINPQERKTLTRANKMAKRAGALSQRKGLPADVTNDLIDIEVALNTLCKHLAGKQ